MQKLLHQHRAQKCMKLQADKHQVVSLLLVILLISSYSPKPMPWLTLATDLLCTIFSSLYSYTDDHASIMCCEWYIAAFNNLCPHTYAEAPFSISSVHRPIFEGFLYLLPLAPYHLSTVTYTPIVDHSIHCVPCLCRSSHGQLH